MTSKVICVNPDDRLLVAEAHFREKKIHHLLVTKNDKLVGILSFGDLLYLLNRMNNDGFEQYRNRIRLKNYRVSEIMTQSVVTIQINEPIINALELLLHKKINCLPVLDGTDITGILTTRDILKYLVKDATSKPNKVS